MRMSTTLSSYLARHFLVWTGGVFLLLSGLVFLFEMVELTRRATGKDEADFAILLQMGLLKLPGLIQDLVPFAVLFGAMAAFFRLTRTRELVVARAAGISVWQFLTPGLSLAVLIGIAQIAVIDPIAATLLARFEQLENRVFRGQPSSLSVSSAGLWLRQGMIDSQDDAIAVLHARSFSQSDMTLQDVTVFEYDEEGLFTARLQADAARLEAGRWSFNNVWRLEPRQPPVQVVQYELDTDLTIEKIQDSFASPATLSFWQLPGFIKVLQAAGFSAHRHRLHFHSQVATPALLGAMVLIAATFSLRYSRRGNEIYFVVFGLLTGFLFYLLTHVVQALGLSANIPVPLAAWTPAGVFIALGISTLMHLEDG